MTPSEFKTLFPEFVSVTDERVQLFMTKAVPHLDVDRWGDLFDEGLSNLVAHLLTVSKRQTDKALANSPEADATVLKAGDTEVRFSERIKVLEVTESPYVSTSYGQQYLYLAKIVGLGGLSV